jgi:uncharacterized SAM-binding protein YcdF (DUF218 family)
MIPTDLDEQVARDARALYEFHSMDSGPVEADLILVAGSHDLRVADRAAELWHEQAAPLIVCSGGSGKVTSHEWSRAEGAVFAQRCVELGVDPDCVIEEREAANTGENFTKSRDLLDGMGTVVGTGIIVSKPYMARRAWATGSRQWPISRWFVRPPNISFEDYPSDETPFGRMVNLMVGDLQRLDVYAKSGFQVPVDVPDAIWAAYERLIRAGYDKFVIQDSR